MAIVSAWQAGMSGGLQMVVQLFRSLFRLREDSWLDPDIRHWQHANRDQRDIVWYPEEKRWGPMLSNKNWKPNFMFYRNHR